MNIFDHFTQIGDFWQRVRGFQPVSLCDWPGKTTAVLFLGGCNLRCPTCHNAGLAFRPGEEVPVDRDLVLDYLVERRRWLDGLVVTGGEPTIHAGSGLLGWLRDLRGATGLAVKLDTNGMEAGVSRVLLATGLVDVLAVDVKGPVGKYPELTGGGVTEVLAAAGLAEHFLLARTFPGRVYFRCTRVPQLTGEDLAEVARMVPEGVAQLRWQEYVPPRVSQASTPTRASKPVRTARTTRSAVPQPVDAESSTACSSADWANAAIVPQIVAADPAAVAVPA